MDMMEMNNPLSYIKFNGYGGIRLNILDSLSSHSEYAKVILYFFEFLLSVISVSNNDKS